MRIAWCPVRGERQRLKDWGLPSFLERTDLRLAAARGAYQFQHDGPEPVGRVLCDRPDLCVENVHELPERSGEFIGVGAADDGPR